MVNFFHTDEDEQKCAEDACDQHVVKIPTEVLQALVQALRNSDCPDHVLPLNKSGSIHRGGYPHHPVTKWCAGARDNFNWAIRYGLALCHEYTFRYGKVHFCEAGLAHIHAKRLCRYIKRGKLRKPTRCFKEHDDLRDTNKWTDVFEAHREFYKRDKATFARWEKGREPPDWWDKDELP